MGFPTAYAELLVPKLLIHLLSLLGLVRKSLTKMFRILGLVDFLEQDIAWSENPAQTLHQTPHFHSVSALLLREILPVVKFSDLQNPPESCAVCLYEFEEDDEIRSLSNCCHVFHKNCLDNWMGYHQRTCPLCRSPVVPDDMEESFNERLWAASGIPDFYGDFTQSVGL